MSDIGRQFGESVKFVRQLQRRSQEDLAENLSIGRTSIANIESGKQFPTLATAVEIADELGTSLDWMIRRNVEPEPKPTQTWTALEALAHRITKGVNREIAEAQRRLTDHTETDGDPDLLKAAENVITAATENSRATYEVAGGPFEELVDALAKARGEKE